MKSMTIAQFNKIHPGTQRRLLVNGLMLIKTNGRRLIFKKIKSDQRAAN